MRFGETMGRRVMGVADAKTVGTVSGFVVDPGPPRVAGLRLRKPGGGSTVLAWPYVQAIGPDAVIARPPDAEVGPEAKLGELAHKRYEPLGKRVLTEYGEELGELDDATFDEQSGALLTLTVSAGDAEEFDARRLAGLGSFALVLRSG